MILKIHKNEGETPLEVLDRIRAEKGLDMAIPMTYAGRLDPLAEGVLIVLTGEDVHRKDEFNNMSKIYEFDILFGVGTDTGDILGRVESHKVHKVESLSNEEIEKTINSFVGKFSQSYPMYSSKTVDGIPLWQYAREGKDVVPPSHEVEIFDIQVLGFEEKSADELLLEIKERIAKVKGDFRQKEILNDWQNHLEAQPLSHPGVELLGEGKKFLIAKCVTTVSSGTYIRVLCDDIGEKLDVPALAWKIERTKIVEK